MIQDNTDPSLETLDIYQKAIKDYNTEAEEFRKISKHYCKQLNKYSKQSKEDAIDNFVLVLVGLGYIVMVGGNLDKVIIPMWTTVVMACIVVLYIVLMIIYKSRNRLCFYIMMGWLVFVSLRSLILSLTLVQ